MSLTQDEVTVLLIAKEGQSMIPIGRWKKPTFDLAAKGLLRKADDVNYFITDQGMQAIEQEDQEAFEGLRQASKKLDAVKFRHCARCVCNVPYEWNYCAKCGVRLG